MKLGDACFDRRRERNWNRKPPPRPTDLERLLTDYTICAAADGLSKHSIASINYSVRYFATFLREQGATTDARDLSTVHLRAYLLYLRQKPCFHNHPLISPQPRNLSGHTINHYMRALHGFFSWLVGEGILSENPFGHLKVPKAPHRIIHTFSQEQIAQLLSVIDMNSPNGFRDHTMILTMLDCGLRVSELTGLELSRVSMDGGTLTVLGKGNRERIVPMGKQLAGQLARYMQLHRPQPAIPLKDYLFLTVDGWPMTKDRVGIIVRNLGKKAGIEGVRCSPHTLRHTAAVNFVRNGGDAFALQKMLGHTSLDMTRRYCELADADLKRAHQKASPVDNLGMAAGPRRRRGNSKGFARNGRK